MLQLILGCAVNCENKQEYIESIMHLEESVQQVLMLAIQEMIKSAGDSPGSVQVTNVMSELEDSNREREELRQRCHEYEIQVKLLSEDKSIISAELDKLQEKVKGFTDDDLESFHHSNQADYQIKDLRRQLEKSQEDVYKMEREKIELSVKVEELEKAIEESSSREAELQVLADQARRLKDEVDILRETSDKVDKYEGTIEKMQKKMEEMADLKRQLKLLETKNTSLMHINIELEEDVKKAGNWRPTMEKYKKQTNELQDKIDAEMKRADKSEFETKRLLEKLEAISVEKDRLQSERDDLKEKFNEVSDQLKVYNIEHAGHGQGRHAARLQLSADGLTDNDHDASMMELIPPAIKEKILRLQAENKRLKEGQSQGDPLLQTTINDLKEREMTLTNSNRFVFISSSPIAFVSILSFFRSLNHKIIELESKLEEGKANAGGATLSGQRFAGSREELELKLSEAGKKISQLNETVAKKDVEMQGMEERYKKYIEKAKSVIKTLDPKQNPNASPETMALRTQLTEKDRLLETLEQETEKARAVREMEERLISSAFYNLSMQMHRTTVEARLSNVHSSGSSQSHGGGQSFLARQRQTQTLQGSHHHHHHHGMNRTTNAGAP